ncbi:MAG: sigma-54-dependent Fis family transcriptional regulator [Desulfobacteraceae bacterium]|nr:sigma-54-dependent Fis family transcriptional regulator [Desulfobacteraceae bacterium]
MVKKFHKESRPIRQRLNALKLRLEQVTHSWNVDEYWSLVKFYSGILPKLMDAERCTIYIIEMVTEKICSMVGTGLEKKLIEPPKNQSIVGRVISTGKAIIAEDLDKRTGYHTRVDAETGFVTRNMVCAPIISVTGHGVTGAIQVLNRRGETSFTEEDKVLLEDISNHLSASIESIMLTQEILRISGQLNREVERFDKGFLRETPFIAESPSMREVLEQVQMLCTTPVNVFIQGENGTGKELIARMIHEESDRRNQPFVPVNCASIPENLMESEFFGYEKGAFTGAVGSRRGYFEEANGGTLFLDEIADMPMIIQPKFLRAIQEGEGYRLGSNRLVRYDLRIISATNKDLKEEVECGRFREDLFFRLFSVETRLPPLRERKDDISLMSFAFLSDVCHRFKKKTAGFSPEVLNMFEDYSWPGNVRQLRREIERMVTLTPTGKRLLPDKCSRELLEYSAERHPEDSPQSEYSLPDQVKSLEIRLIKKALKETRYDKAKASRLLGITRQGLYKKLKRYGVSDKA